MSSKIVDAKSVASYFINRSSELNESNDLTNLKLQKILFYTQAESVRTNGVPLFGNTIEAWGYGPVVEDVYHWLKGCGAYPISAFDIPTDISELKDEHNNLLARVWDEYSKFSAGFLVTKTHETGAAWDIAFKRRNKVIDIDELCTVKLAHEW